MSIFLSRSRTVIDPFPVVFGAVTKSSYLKKYLSVFTPNRYKDFSKIYENPGLQDEYAGHVYSATDYINNNLKEKSTILFLGETIHAYIEKPYICSSAFNKNILVNMLYGNISINNISDQLQALNITHILLNIDELWRLGNQGYEGKLGKREVERLQKFINDKTESIFRAGPIVILELTHKK